MRGILERFLNAVGCLDACFVADETLESLPLPTKVGQPKVGGIDFNKPPDAPSGRSGHGVVHLAHFARGVYGFGSGAKGPQNEWPSGS